MSTFYHIHSSSRYDRSRASLSAAIDRYIELASLITFTEVSNNERAGALIRPGFGRIIGNNGGFDDCGIMYKKSRWTLLHREQFHTGRGRYAAIGVFRDNITNKKLVVAVPHFPAHVEEDMTRRRRTARTMLWNSSVQRLRMRANRLKRRFKAHGVMITGDWNLNIKRRWVRGLIHGLFPFWNITWRAPYPAGGTHENRLIDLTVKKGKIKVVQKPRLLKDDGSSDHRPYIEGLRLTA